jgi:hypothetical protein
MAELENLFDTVDSIWIYGGWIGMTAFLLKSRNNIKILSEDDIIPIYKKIIFEGEEYYYDNNNTDGIVFKKNDDQAKIIGYMNDNNKIIFV